MSADKFLETEFEEMFVYYAQQFGHAGKELERGRRMEDVDFEFPDPNAYCDVTEEYYEETEDASGAKIDVLRQRKRRVRYAEAFAQQYIADLNTALRAKTKYQSDKQQLCSELLLRLDKSLRNTVTQHTQYKEAKRYYQIMAYCGGMCDGKRCTQCVCINDEIHQPEAKKQRSVKF